LPAHTNLQLVQSSPLLIKGEILTCLDREIDGIESRVLVSASP